ncbi:MAG: hypothetical protein AAFU64_21045 [Bacteroidota bacterium]
MASLLFIYGYFRYDTVFLAFRSLSKDDYEGAERILRPTYYPKYLSKNHKGLLHGYKRDLKQGQEHLLKAWALGVRTQHNQALMALQLAKMELEWKNPQKTKAYRQEIKTIKDKADIQPEIDQLEKDLDKASPAH